MKENFKKTILPVTPPSELSLAIKSNDPERVREALQTQTPFERRPKGTSKQSVLLQAYGTCPYNSNLFPELVIAAMISGPFKKSPDYVGVFLESEIVSHRAEGSGYASYLSRKIDELFLEGVPSFGYKAGVETHAVSMLKTAIDLGRKEELTIQPVYI